VVWIKRMEVQIEGEQQSQEQEMLHGHCYCGDFEFQIPREITPYRSLYCHCDSCRRSHSSPIYQVVYLPESEFIILKGMELAQEYRKANSNVTRAFCRECGSRLYNKLHREERKGWLGIFPNLFDEEIQKNLPVNLLPTHHLHTGECSIDLEKLHDDLLRIVE
jgi:hypothetical protein